MPEGDVRARVLTLARRFPGLHLRQLAREAGVTEQLAAYHVGHLEAEGRLRTETGGGYLRIYAAETPELTAADRRVLHVLRQRMPLQTVLLLLTHRRLSNADLARLLGVTRSTVSYHTRKLADAGIVAHDGAGLLEVADPARIERLLLDWEAPPGLVERFSGMWDRFYRSG